MIITVEYSLDDDTYERLKCITEESKKHGLYNDCTYERMFQMIMEIGSVHDINDKLKFHEFKLGLRESYK